MLVHLTYVKHDHSISYSTAGKCWKQLEISRTLMCVLLEIAGNSWKYFQVVHTYTFLELSPYDFCYKVILRLIEFLHILKFHNYKFIWQYSFCTNKCL